jgi:hypothetical protein
MPVVTIFIHKQNVSLIRDGECSIDDEVIPIPRKGEFFTSIVNRESSIINGEAPYEAVIPTKEESEVKDKGVIDFIKTFEYLLLL